MGDELKRKTPPAPWDRRIIPTASGYHYLEHADRVPMAWHGGRYNPVQAWWLSEMSALAYVGHEHAADVLAGAGFSTYRGFDGSHCRCFVTSDGTGHVVVFRGTDVRSFAGLLDVVAAIRVSLVAARLAEGRVHRGFQATLDEVWDGETGVASHLRRSRPDPRSPLYITGHSLGGALALIAAARLSHSGVGVSGVYTLGTPRVGDATFCGGIGAPVYRLVHDDDPFVHVPPPALFHHGGDRVDVTTGAAPPGTPTNHSPIYYAIGTWNEVASTPR